ncbi:MAG: peptide chain release factor N(5)-glutamine methyltransferase [Clostridiales bacterium]|nr:peptide chain release factor N(5)-glutamine methyltransferase [Clostridiales bacterium]
MVISRLRAELRNKLNKNSHEADWIISHVTGMSQTDFILNPREITDDELSRIHSIVSRRSQGEPLQYILGTTEFMGLEFKVNSSTLIPRQDSETLAEAAAEYISDKNLNIIDIGCGSGCIGITIAKLCKNAHVTLLDISSGALETAEENARLNGVNIQAVKCDILKELPDGSFDVIVSNPPYIETDTVATLDDTVKSFEPLSALDGGSDGLKFYRKITAAAHKMFTSDGFILFEIGCNQGSAVSDILLENGFTDIKITQDPCGNDRVVTAKLTKEQVWKKISIASRTSALTYVH